MLVLRKFIIYCDLCSKSEQSKLTINIFQFVLSQSFAKNYLKPIIILILIYRTSLLDSNILISIKA